MLLKFISLADENENRERVSSNWSHTDKFSVLGLCCQGPVLLLGLFIEAYGCTFADVLVSTFTELGALLADFSFVHAPCGPKIHTRDRK